MLDAITVIDMLELTHGTFTADASELVSLSSAISNRLEWPSTRQAWLADEPSSTSAGSTQVECCGGCVTRGRPAGSLTGSAGRQACGRGGRLREEGRLLVRGGADTVPHNARSGEARGGVQA
jgi:hypothetical protein